jgi:chitodextrinase
MNPPRTIRARIAALALAVSTVGVVTAQLAQSPAAEAAVAQQLTRYPYLTDVVTQYATVNWGTDRSQTTGSVKYGVVGSNCATKSVSASKTSISVGSVSEYQWKAKLTGLSPDTQYCYRVFLGTTDLLGTDASPQFFSALPAGSNASYSFAVFGDWGDTNQQGANPQQAALDSLIGQSGVRFALSTGDTAYDSGSQLNYGDLNQTGYRISSIFGPNFWPQAGSQVPLFSVPGNHGANATFFTNWPQARAVAGSSGSYQMDTYCCLNGSNSAKSPSAWYAFDQGNARFYVLTAAWSDSNVGNSTSYGMDAAYRWQQSSAEYQWLKHDLETHPSQLKFAIFHYPLYSDNFTEPSDTSLQGPDSLQGLLEGNGVDMVFNGHAHLYERNVKTAGGLVTYVTGGGGAKPEPISHCQPYDAYGIGWSSTGGSKCGAAPAKPTQIDQVFHYLRVDVNGQQVTVTPINSLGQSFDQQTYDFSPDNTPPTAPTNLQASAPVGNRVDLQWGASTDANGISAYDIYRDGTKIDSVAGGTLTYSDNTVSPNTPYSYVVKARDPSGNTSDPSNTASLTTPSIDSVNPDPPTNLQANAPSAGRVDLTWGAGSDNVGVTAYDIYRNGGGVPIATVGGNQLSYSDQSVSAGTPYSYTVRARDAAGNQSVDSNTAVVTTPATGVLFQDDFESGSLSMWSTVAGLSVSQGITAPSGGQWVARETASGAGSTYAFKSISPAVTDMYARFRFQVLSRTGAVDLMRFRNGSGGSKLSLLVNANGKLATRNATGTSTASTVSINTNQWYTVEIHGQIGSPSTTEVWLDGTLVPELGATGDLGTTNFGQFLLGHTGATGTYDVAFDDVTVSKSFI